MPGGRLGGRGSLLEASGRVLPDPPLEVPHVHFANAADLRASCQCHIAEVFNPHEDVLILIYVEP